MENIFDITVVLPVYNGGEYLQLSIDSVLNQQGVNIEFLIVDDCSTDGSWEYLQNIKDNRVALFRNTFNRGLFYNLNFLIKKSNSNLIKLWSQDDLMNEGCLLSFVNFHSKLDTIGFSYSSCEKIDEYGNVKNTILKDNTPEIISKDLHASICYYTGSIAGNIANVCITKNALDKVGLFNESMKISADFDMWVKLAKYYNIGFINIPLVKIRDHNGQLSRQEKFYVNHVEEDARVYNYLNSYISKDVQIKYNYYFVHYKLVFYFSLLIRSLVRVRFLQAFKIARIISRFTSLLTLVFIYVRIKLFRNVRKEFSI